MSSSTTLVALDKTIEQLTTHDPCLKPYADHIRHRILMVDETEFRLTQGITDLADFASGHEYFGMHYTDDCWVFREWAPNATAITLKGSFNGWQASKQYALNRLTDDGIWEIVLDPSAVAHGDVYRIEIRWPGGSGERIPAWVRRVVQDVSSSSFNAQVWQPNQRYTWQHPRPKTSDEPLLVYESHVGMAQDAEKVGSYLEFKDNVLPRIRDAGYNAIQLMAIAEHPYYGSFGYQVSNFFACSSRFGTPEELKALIDKAHGMGLIVLMDLIHSHAVKNEVEGIARFDGSKHQYFHAGSRGEHPACSGVFFCRVIRRTHESRPRTCGSPSCRHRVRLRVRPRDRAFRNEISRSRLLSTSKLKSVIVKIWGSGLNVTLVPVLSLLPIGSTGAFGTPRSYS